MTFTIFCTFWVFAPVLSFLALIYFVLVQCAFRYLILYVHMPVYESGGLFYYRMVDRVLFGLTVSNIVVLFWLASVKLWGYAVMVAPIPLIVVAFGRFAREAYEKPSRELPLDESRFRDHSVQSEVSLRFDAALYTQPALRDRGDLDADAELAALLRDDDMVEEPPKRTCCGRREKEKQEEVRAMRRASRGFPFPAAGGPSRPSRSPTSAAATIAAGPCHGHRHCPFLRLCLCPWLCPGAPARAPPGPAALLWVPLGSLGFRLLLGLLLLLLLLGSLGFPWVPLGSYYY